MSKKNTNSRNTELTPLQREIVGSIKSGKSLMGEGGVLTSLIKGALEAALEGEIESHISAKPLETNYTNRRNGKGTKVMHSEHGSFELSTPRDRDSSLNRRL